MKQNEFNQKIPNTRVDGLDNLKVALTFLVIAHHAGQPYGENNGFWYFESGGSQLNLGLFFSTNAGFFMSLFFFISAYFIPTSYERKGAITFVVERLKKFALPLVTGFLIIIPLLMYIYYIKFRNYPEINFWTYYRDIYFGFVGMPPNWNGPSWPDMQFAHLWFLQHLLVYAVIYACIRVIIDKKHNQTTRPLRLYHLFFITVLISLITYVVRIIYPIDYWTGFLGFIQAEYAHLPQYATLFTMGIFAAKYNSLNQLSVKVGVTTLTVALIIIILRYTGLLNIYAKGGSSWDAFGYAFIETFLCVSLCIGLSWFFLYFFNFSNRITRLLSSATFGMYIIHVPIVVILQFYFATIAIPTTMKFLIVVVIGSLLSFITTVFYHTIIKKAKLLKLNL